MKIIVASDSPVSIHKVMKLLSGHDVLITESGEEIFQLLSEGNCECLITEFTVNDIDAWHLSIFIKNNINKDKHTLPFFVISDNNQRHPALLKSNHELQTIDLSSTFDIDELVSNYTVDKPTILIIEDDKDIAVGMSLILRKNYIVDICHDKEEGVKCWKRKKHDLLLLDLMLPGGSGEDVLAEIKKINPNQDIVIVSARSEMEIKEKYMLLGIEDYLVKPFKARELNQVCRVVLTRAILKNELIRQERLMDSFVKQILPIIEQLENDEVESAIESLTQIIDSMNSKNGEDYYLNNILS